MMGETTLVLKGGSTIYLNYCFKEDKYETVMGKTGQTWKKRKARNWNRVRYVFGLLIPDPRRVHAGYTLYLQELSLEYAE